MKKWWKNNDVREAKKGQHSVSGFDSRGCSSGPPSLLSDDGLAFSSVGYRSNGFFKRPTEMRVGSSSSLWCQCGSYRGCRQAYRKCPVMNATSGATVGDPSFTVLYKRPVFTNCL